MASVEQCNEVSRQVLLDMRHNNPIQIMRHFLESFIRHACSSTYQGNSGPWHSCGAVPYSVST
eukprot:3483993-Pyramimonas_sp.AAC.1